jgi:hypothetical protein
MELKNVEEDQQELESLSGRSTGISGEYSVFKN